MIDDLNADEVNAAFFEASSQNGENGSSVAALEMADIKELADEYAKWHNRRRDLETELKEVMAKIGQIDRAMVTAFENAGAEKMRMAPGLFTKDEQEYVSIDEEKYTEAERWIVNHGGGWMIKPSVHPQRLRSFVIRTRDEDKEEIPDCFRVNKVTKIKFTPKKVKE